MATTLRVTITDEWTALSSGEADVLVQVVHQSGAIEVVVATETPVVNDIGHVLLVRHDSLDFVGLGLTENVYARALSASQPATVVVTK